MFDGPGLVEEVAVEAVHGAHFATGVGAIDDGVGVDAGLAFHHDEVIFEGEAWAVAAATATTLACGGDRCGGVGGEGLFGASGGGFGGGFVFVAEGAGAAVVDDGEVDHVGGDGDDFDAGGGEASGTGAVVEVEGAGVIDIAGFDAVEVVDEFLSVFDEGGGGEVAEGVLAEGDGEESVGHDEGLDVIAFVIAGLGGGVVHDE